MKALVTGGAGFIGSNLVDALLERGDEIVVLDDLSTGREVNLEGALGRGAQLVRGDIRDAATVDSLFQNEKPETVFHLAAQIDVRVSVADPAFDAGINVLGTVNLLRAAHAAGVGRFVFASTGGAIYGEGQPPFPEDAPIEPLAPYGQAKFAAEGYCDLYRRLHGLSTVAVRYANVYGPRQDPLGEAGVIAIFCDKLAAGGRPTVYGDGLQTRDYVYVGDVVTATLAAADSETAAGPYNVGRGEETSVLDLIDQLRALGAGLGLPGGAGAAFDPDFAPARPGEVLRSALDPTRAQAELGFTAECDLEEGLRLTLGSAARSPAAARAASNRR